MARLRSLYDDAVSVHGKPGEGLDVAPGQIVEVGAVTESEGEYLAGGKAWPKAVWELVKTDQSKAKKEEE